MSTTEHTINDTLAAVLRGTRRAWESGTVVRSENIGMLRDSAGRPDILVLEPTVSPVSVETEILPAVTVESEARSRIGCALKSNGREILSSIAVRLSKDLRNLQGVALAEALANANDIEMALYTGSTAASACRWPASGWITGSARDLSILVQVASVPPELVEKAANELVDGVTESAAMMHDVEHQHPGAMKKIADALKQAPSEQTRRMASTILANAFVFQETLANGPGELSSVRSLAEMDDGNGIQKTDVLNEWRKILKVNYWPIFAIALRILQVVPPQESKALIERLALTANRLLQDRLMRSHDLTGAVFQKLIADRKFLAAYYTTPSSAALLVGLAITPETLLANGNWADRDAVSGLRVADFSCGTGTLLSTAYQRIGQLHELSGGNSEAIHPEMMANSLVGCDVLPAAAHLTASMLAGTHPTVKYKKSSILTMAYGVSADDRIALGSLDLLDPQKELEVVAITAKSAGGEGESEQDIWTTLPHQDFDLVIMNPPFTRATGQEGEKKGFTNPMFAAFAATPEHQRAMARATEKLVRGTSAHGNAGEASHFLVLADRKLKTGGTLALVMPLSFLSGEAWEASRNLLSAKYQDLLLISIAGATDSDMAFSADTGMGECLVIGRKSTNGPTEAFTKVQAASDRATFIVLRRRPDSRLLGLSVAQEIRRLILNKKIRKIEDGPFGGTKLWFGSELVGQAITAPVSDNQAWNPVRIADLSLSQTVFQMKRGSLWLPGMAKAEATTISLTKVSSIGTVGPYHSDIDFVTQTGASRGPFEHIPLQAGEVPTYPILWSHEANRERCIGFEADCEGVVRTDATDEKINRIWSTRSHCHFNQNFRFTSQSTAMQYTETETMGGRAWISIKLKNPDQEKALALWGNTTLGILMHWHHANKQQAGRGNVVNTSLSNLDVLDVTSLTSSQLASAVKLFHKFKTRILLSVDEIASDIVRRELDEQFLTLVLDVSGSFVAEGGPLHVLRNKLAAEPSIVGRAPGTKKRTKKIIPTKVNQKHKAIGKTKASVKLSQLLTLF